MRVGFQVVEVAAGLWEVQVFQDSGQNARVIEATDAVGPRAIPQTIWTTVELREALPLRVVIEVEEAR